MTDGTLQTEFAFTLPQGYVDSDGTLHREGRMRLATAADEIKPLNNSRVQSNASYLTIVLLSRVITELGDLDRIDKHVVEDLYVRDLEYLQNMYARINHQGTNTVSTVCPECDHEFDVEADTGSVPGAADIDAREVMAGEPAGNGGE